MAFQMYQYDAIGHDDEIRLLHLEMAHSETAPLRCQISHARLTQQPIYEALSYTLGGAVADTPLVCTSADDAALVTSNCQAALLKLRQQDRERILWIDVICIDQRNTPERNNQVLLMSTIYRQAMKVIVYLGEGTKETDQGMDFILEDEIMMRGRGGCPPVGLGPGVTSSPQQKAVDAILARPYFSRMWIIQELVFASDVEVICGNRAVNWRSFSLTANYVDMTKKRFNIRRLGYRPLPSVVYYRNTYRIDDPSTLLQDLGDTTHCMSTDAQDKVFALVGMSPEGGNPALRPDYSQSVTQIYAGAA